MSDQDSIAGEDSLVQDYFAPLASGFAGAFGLEDDCAALTPEPGRDLVLTTDAIAEGVDFLAQDQPEDIAWRAVAVNVSDLAAKGARPIGYLLSIAFPRAPQRIWLEQFVSGLRTAQEQFGMVLMGGDTDRRPDAPLSMTVTAIGNVPTGRMVRRGGARPGDLLYVSGTLGDAALGLQLRYQAASASAVSQSDREYLTGRLLHPQPRLELRDALLGYARAAMDLSDGLVKDLGRLCRASGVAAEVEAARLPLSEPAKRVTEVCPEWRELQLIGGDDYEILASVAPEKAAAFESAGHAAGIPVTQIGKLQAGSGVRVIGWDGQPMNLVQTGYDHFRR